MMSRLCIFLLVLGCLFGSQQGKGQDIHFTLFDMSPLNVNPANAGGFSGSVRISGIFRDQWFSGLNQSDGAVFLTPSINIDAPIVRGFRKQDWVGVGAAYLFNDRAGYFEDTQGKKGNIVSSGFIAGAAYHFSLDEEQNTVITFGAQYGNLTRSLRQINFQYENTLLGSGPTRTNAEEEATFDTDINAGLMLSGKSGDSTYYRIGLAMYHINQPEANFGNGPREQLNARISVHGMYEYPVSENLIITPRVLFQNVQSTSELVLQGLGSYRFNQATWLHAGLGYRLGDAVQVLAGVNLKKLRIMASYDLTISDLATASTFELSAQYIFNIYKKPKLTPVIFCPRF